MADTKSDGGARDDQAMRIDQSLVRQLAELLTENELSEIEVADGDRRIKVRREPAPVMAGGGHMASPAPAAPAAAPQAAAAAPIEEPSGDAVKSPMVGTAFLSPEPGGTPFVREGATVKAGDTLVIIEAMKVMNPITAPRAGTVTKVLVADAQPVEFDQPLVVLG